MKIKLLANYSTYRIGDIIDIEPPAMAERMIADGIAVCDGQQDLFVEQATAEPVAETAAVTPKKRGRPRAVPQPDEGS